MPAGLTYDAIATFNLANLSTITFSSIPQTFTNLRCVIAGTAFADSNIIFRINGDTSSNYLQCWGYATGSAGTAGRVAASATSFAPNRNFGSTCSSLVIDFIGYTNNSRQKPVFYRLQSTPTNVNEIGGGFNFTVTDPITSLTITNTTDSFFSNTTATLFGIAAA